MSSLPKLTFVSNVRSVDAAPEQVAVTFLTQAARFWVSPSRPEVVSALQQALDAQAQVQVTWNPLSREILDARLAS
jgi:hypothetical protein